MRYALAVLALALAACDSQGPVRAPLGLDPALDSLSRVDAGVLALRHTLAAGDTSRVELDPDLVDDLYRAVGSVRASEHAALVAGIRTFPRFPADEIYVFADTSASWTQGWRDGEDAPGYAPVDRLVRTYGLRLQSFRDSNRFDSAVLVSDRPLNTLALGRLFEQVDGVRFSSANARAGDGNDIEAEREGGGWRLDFSIGSGDCPAGCISRQYWTFRVGSGGEVTYLGTRTNR